MAAFDFVRPSNQYPGEIVLGAGDWQRWDVQQWKSVNGDLGGGWAPSKPIVIGGAGLQSSVSGSLVSGGVTTATGGRVIIASSAGDTPTLNPSRSRTITVPLQGNVYSPADFPNPGQFQSVFDDAHGWGVMSIGAGTPFAIEVPGRYMHIGAQLRRASLSFVVTQKPTSLPSTPMFLMLYGVDESNTGHFGNPSILSLGAGPPPAFGIGNIGAWTTGATATLGAYWIPSVAAKTTGYYYKITNAGSGTIGAVEPTWTTTVGASTTPDSNGVVWTCTGLAGIAFPGTATVDSYYANGQPQSLELDLDGAGSGTYTNVITIDRRYAFVIESSDPTVLLTGLELTFDTVTSLAFE